MAGSERLALSGAEGQAKKETAAINSSLSCLGDVLSALVAGARVVPFRNSKLTLLLQDGLGGNSRTAILVCLQTQPHNYTDAKMALNFSVKARKVSTRAEVNFDGAGLSVLGKFFKENEVLRPPLLFLTPRSSGWSRRCRLCGRPSGRRRRPRRCWRRWRTRAGRLRRGRRMFWMHFRV